MEHGTQCSPPVGEEIPFWVSITLSPTPSVGAESPMLSAFGSCSFHLMQSEAHVARQSLAERLEIKRLVLEVCIGFENDSG